MKMSRFSHPQIALILALCMGAFLRFYGLDWGTDHQTGTFHHFHTDESTIVESTYWIGKDINQIHASYGKAPMYILWATANTLGTLSGNTLFAPDNNTPHKFTYIVGRSISALMGVLLILIAYHLGCALHTHWTGALSAALTAVCPGLIQQSHYYTVDPAMTFWVGLGLLLALKLPSKDWRLYVAFGLVSGLATGTRLVGIWLAFPFFVAHLWPIIPSFKSIFTKEKWTEIGRQLPYKNIGLTALTGLVVLLICEPFIILNPQHYFDTSDIRQFAPSMGVAKGEIVRVWTLYDFQTTPYLYYLSHLWRYALTWPLELVGLAGVFFACAKRPKTALLLLAWLLPYYLLVGGLHTKPIRYATPTLPALIILGAWTCMLWGQWLQTQWKSKSASAMPAVLILFITTAHGLALARIYGQEDSRIVAARWIQNNIPKHSGVMVENGGFPTAWMLPEQAYKREFTDSSYYLIAQNWVPYSTQVLFFQNRISRVEWIVLIEENRMRPFMAVSKQYPIGSEIYTRLNREELGFKRVKTFKTQPTLGPWTPNESTAEPTITAFDHPTISIFQRMPDRPAEDLLDIWIDRIQQSPNLPDYYVFEGVAAFKQKEWETAKQFFHKAQKIQPNFALANLLIGEVDLKNNDETAAQQEWDRATALAGPIPKEAFIGMIDSGLKKEGAVYLEKISNDESDTFWHLYLNKVYLEIGLEKHQAEDYQAALSAYEKAMTFAPEKPTAYVNAANSLIYLGNLDRAEQLLRFAQSLDSTYAPTLKNQIYLYQKRNNLEAAYQLQIKALDQDPQNLDFQVELFNIGITYYQQGNQQKAFDIFQKCLEYNPNFKEVQFNLGAIYLHQGDYGHAQDHLQKAVQLAPTDLESLFALGNAFEGRQMWAQAREQYRNILTQDPKHTAAQERLTAIQNQ